MPGVRPDFEKRRERADELHVLAKQRAAVHVLPGVVGDDAAGLAERGEVVELDLGALDGERLRFGFARRFVHWTSFSKGSERRSSTRTSGEKAATSGRGGRP